MEHDLDKKWIEIRLNPDGTFWIRAVKVVDAGSVDYQSWTVAMWEDVPPVLQEAVEGLYATDKCSGLS